MGWYTTREPFARKDPKQRITMRYARGDHIHLVDRIEAAALVADGKIEPGTVTYPDVEEAKAALRPDHTPTAKVRYLARVAQAVGMTPQAVAVLVHGLESKEGLTYQDAGSRILARHNARLSEEVPEPLPEDERLPDAPRKRVARRKKGVEA